MGLNLSELLIIILISLTYTLLPIMILVGVVLIYRKVSHKNDD